MGIVKIDDKCTYFEVLKNASNFDSLRSPSFPGRHSGAYRYLLFLTIEIFVQSYSPCSACILVSNRSLFNFRPRLRGGPYSRHRLNNFPNHTYLGVRLSVDLWHAGSGPAKVSGLRCRILCVIVRDGRFDGVLCEHRAVDY